MSCWCLTSHPCTSASHLSRVQSHNHQARPALTGRNMKPQTHKRCDMGHSSSPLLHWPPLHASGTLHICTYLWKCAVEGGQRRVKVKGWLQKCQFSSEFPARVLGSFSAFASWSCHLQCETHLFLTTVIFKESQGTGIKIWLTWIMSNHLLMF